MIINEKYKYSDLTAKIIGAAMEVHKFLGNGFQEVIYQRALAVELNRKGLFFVREQEMWINYKGTNIGTRRMEFKRLMRKLKNNHSHQVIK